MAGAIEKLQHYLIEHQLLTIEQKIAESNTHADEGNAIIADKHEDAVEREEDDRMRLYGPFGLGLKRAAAVRDSQKELALDDSDPLDSAIADALVRYLVRTDLAEVRSEEQPGTPSGEFASDGTMISEPMPNYTYYFTFNWPAIQDATAAAGTSLDEVMRDAAD